MQVIENKRSFGIRSPAAPIIYRIACSNCGSGFDYKKSGRGRLPRFCSAGCKRAMMRLQNAAYRADGRYAFAGVCAICATDFKSASPNTQTCSISCQAVLRRQLKGRSKP